MTSFVNRMVGAAKLDLRIYEEVEADRNATGPAMGVVILSSIAQGIAFISYGPRVLIEGTFFALIGWVIWASLTCLIGTRILPEPQTRSDIGELLRTMGFASSPGIFRVLGIISTLGRVIRFPILVWMLVTMIIAVRQALDYRSMGRAVAVCVIGFAIYLSLEFAGILWVASRLAKTPW
jgi:hypothetical protein